MPVQLIEKAPYTRCYKCGNTNIAYVCHHCGRAICIDHQPNVFHPEAHKHTIEFTDLGFENSRCGQVPAHCMHCDHIIRKPNAAPIVFGIFAGITGTGFLLQKSENTVMIGILCILLGLLTCFSGVIVYKKRERIVAESRPPLPLFPRFETIKMKEQWYGHITMGNDCTYNIDTHPVKGTLRMPVKFSKLDRDRLQLYREKYNLGETTNIQFHSGFVTFKGPIGFKLANPGEVHKMNGLVIPLKSHINKHPYLSGTSEKESSEWVIEKEYTLLENYEPEMLPIRVVPSLIQKTGKRLLELEIQWEDPTCPQNKFEANERKTKFAFGRIELLELLVPHEYGEVEELIYDGVIGKKNISDHNVVRTITWKKPPIPQKEWENQRCSFFIRFEKEIDLSSVIQGRLEISFKNALSMVEDIDFYYPLGTKSNEITTDIETTIITDFHLSLSSLRYQDVRLVPNPKVEADKDKQEIMTFEGVIPNHSTVMALTNAISNEGFYVQRVVEDPPRAGKQAQLINRCWDIAGRHYIGVYPIDFHLTVNGEEKYSGEIRDQGGTTKTILIVQGMYANRDMESLIENVWERLSYIIKDTFEQLYKITPAEIKEDHIQREAGIDTSTPQPIIEDQLKQWSELYKHLDNLREAFTAARVFENTYLELKTRIEKELQALHSTFKVVKNK